MSRLCLTLLLASLALVPAHAGSAKPDRALEAAVVLGGASLSGGRGGIFGTVLAVLIVGVLGNGLIQLNVPSFWIEVAGGLLLLGAVTVDRVRVRLTRADL